MENLHKYEILIQSTGVTYQVPIVLQSYVDEMGIIVGFDGDIEHVEHISNFTYTGTANTVRVYNTVNTNQLRTLTDAVFTISWGDGSPDDYLPMVTPTDLDLPVATHTYTESDRSYDIGVNIESPWGSKGVTKTIQVPFINHEFPIDMGTLTFTVPYSSPEITQTQDYLMDYREITGGTSGATISFLAAGKSRLDEFKQYGSSNMYDDVDITPEFTGYTIDGLYYMDYPDGYTYITGNTSEFFQEEVYDGMVTRNEHLIGFIDQPQIYSDIFVDRGRMGVLERTLRLCEVDGVEELELYGGGFFTIKNK